MINESRFQRSDVWVGALLGTGLFTLAESMAGISGSSGWHEFLAGAFYFHLVVLMAVGHYLAKGSKIPSMSRRLLLGFLAVPLGLLTTSAVLAPTSWASSYGDWGVIFAGLCSQVLPAALMIFLLLLLGQNARKERQVGMEIGFYSLAAVCALSCMAWLENGVGFLTGIVALQISVATTYVFGRHAGRVAAVRYRRSPSR